MGDSTTIHVLCCYPARRLKSCHFADFYIGPGPVACSQPSLASHIAHPRLQVQDVHRAMACQCLATLICTDLNLRFLLRHTCQLLLCQGLHSRHVATSALCGVWCPAHNHPMSQQGRDFTPQHASTQPQIPAAWFGGCGSKLCPCQ